MYINWNSGQPIVYQEKNYLFWQYNIEYRQYPSTLYTIFFLYIKKKTKNIKTYLVIYLTSIYLTELFLKCNYNLYFIFNSIHEYLKYLTYTYH